ncbi:MAG: DUF6513 domain-containing protein [Planctomycetota bacterium]
MNQPNQKIHFVTGKLAARALELQLQVLADKVGFEYTIQVLPITVAALLTPRWIAGKLKVPDGTQRLILPGYCYGDLEPIRRKTSVSVELGPKDLRRLPEFFGAKSTPPDFGKWSVEIIAEINHAPRMSISQIVGLAKKMIADGADLIDIGCEPNSIWNQADEAVRAVVDLGVRVSIDSLQPEEITPAVRAGAELVLSVNSTNRQFAPDWGCEVVVIPDQISDLTSMDETIEFLAGKEVPIRIDPIVEPIGFGFARSLRRYMEARDRWPDAKMMMGVGNLTELSDVDSSGINFLLLAICEELMIGSVLTTQVINWARSSVKEIDIARRLVHYAIQNRVPPKHLSDQLLVLRDPKLVDFGSEAIAALAEQIKDRNYRIFAEQDEVHLLGSRQHFHHQDPFVVFDQLMETSPKNMDPSHAFYLGYEMCKAMIAIQLGKQYTQDEALHWGHLTIPETERHRLQKSRPKKKNR